MNHTIQNVLKEAKAQTTYYTYQKETVVVFGHIT